MSRMRSRMLMMEPQAASGPALADILDYSPYVWLNAANYSGAADDLVTTMANAGSLGGNFSNAGGTVRPTYRAAGLSGGPSFQFDGGDNFSLANAEIGTFTTIALFSATGNGFIYEHGSGAGGSDGQFVYTDQISIWASRQTTGTGLSSYNQGASWGSDGNAKLIRHVCGGAHATHKLWIAGVQQSPTADATTLAAFAAVTDTLFVGCRNAASIFLTGHIAQLLLFTPALSDANAAAVEAILTSVYNL